jgi:NADH-quinone oxidoreductase subunit F
MHKMLNRILDGRGKPKDMDMLMELALSQGAMPGTTICGLADGTNWVVKTILQKFPEDFKKYIRSDMVQGVQLTAGAVRV